MTDRKLRATDIAWPQDAQSLIEMAAEWPLPTDDAGALLTGDVLIHKLGVALTAAERRIQELEGFLELVRLEQVRAALGTDRP